MKRSKQLFAVALLIWIATAGMGAQGLVAVPGTQTSLRPPAGFVLAERFTGFQGPEATYSIMVTEMPGAPIAALLEGMTTSRMAAQGMTLIFSRAQKIGGREARLMQVEQTAAGTVFVKWLLIIGTEKQSVMVVGTVPKTAAAEMGPAITNALLTTSWTSSPSTPSFEGLSYRVSSTPALTITFRMGNMLALTENGSFPVTDPTRALYIVAPSYSTLAIPDLRAFAEARARQIDTLTGVVVLEGRAVMLGDLAAYELQADGIHVKTGTAVRVYQVIAPDEGGYIVIQGLVGKARAAEMLPEFRRVTATFRTTVRP
jgi:hypothetical protein